jgi:hypothetical protein
VWAPESRSENGGTNVNIARQIHFLILGLLLSAAAILGLAAPVHADDDTYAAIAYSESTAK